MNSFHRYLNQFKQFNNPSSWTQHRGKKTKKRLFYGVIIFNSIVYYTSRYNTDLYFYFQPTEQNIEIIKNCDQLRKGTYKSTFYLSNSLLMSIYGAKFDPVPYLKYKRQFVDLKDGGHMALDWAPIHNKFEDTEDMRILIILHGLTGGSESNYMKHAALNSYRFGFRTVCVNYRGIDSEMKNEIPNDFTKTDDLEVVIENIQNQYPKAKLYGMGISMGANQLLKYAGEKSEKCKLNGIVSISNPWDILETSHTLQKWSKGIYNRAICKNYVRNYKRNIEQLEKIGSVDHQKVLKSKKIEEYHENFTQKVFGCENMEEVYDKSSCKHHISKVNVPTLAIQALNDPVCDPKNIPKNEIKENDNIILVTTERGGHIDYFTGFKAIRWVYWPALEFLDYVDREVVSKNDIQEVN